jgi:hypothetical protein
MRGHRYLVGLAAALMAASTIILAGPAGAVISNACTEGNNPGLQGNASGLTGACTFTAAGISGATAFTIAEYGDAEWLYGAARNITGVKEKRTGTAPGTTAGQTTFQNTAAGVNNAGNLPIGVNFINHSIEGPGIAPGSFVSAVSGTTVTPNLPLVAGGPTCPGTYADGCTTNVTQIKVGNSTNRMVSDGATSAGVNAGQDIVTSATAHFCAAASATCSNGDVGMRISGGDLPDGATVLSVQSATQVTTTCTGCIAAAHASSASGLPITLQRPNANTSFRYVTGASFSGAHTINSADAKFAGSDIGLVVTGAGISPGSRIIGTSSNGTTTTATIGGNALTVGGGHSFTIGLAPKNFPANNDVVAQLAIALKVNPLLSPTSPPCAANKVSGFQIELQWKQPGAYDLLNDSSTHFSGSSVPGVSSAQFEFPSSATTFAGFLIQNVTVPNLSTAPTTNSWTIKHTFLPIGVGLCPGEPLMGTWNFNAISLAQAQAPSGTGPPGAGELRSLKPEPQNTTKTYSDGVSPHGVGAKLTTNGTTQPTNTNACTVTSPNAVAVGC